MAVAIMSRICTISGSKAWPLPALEGDGADEGIDDEHRYGENLSAMLQPGDLAMSVGGNRFVGAGRIEDRAALVDGFVHGCADGAHQAHLAAELRGVRNGSDAGRAAPDKADADARAVEADRQLGRGRHASRTEALMIENRGDQVERGARAVELAHIGAGALAAQMVAQPGRAPLDLADGGPHRVLGLRLLGDVDADRDHGDDGVVEQHRKGDRRLGAGSAVAPRATARRSVSASSVVALRSAASSPTSGHDRQKPEPAGRLDAHDALRRAGDHAALQGQPRGGEIFRRAGFGKPLPECWRQQGQRAGGRGILRHACIVALRDLGHCPGCYSTMRDP